jgi:hypothetical protein
MRSRGQRPQGVAELLDETFRLYRRRFFLFVGLSVIFLVPALVLGYLAYASVSAGLIGLGLMSLVGMGSICLAADRVARGEAISLRTAFVLTMRRALPLLALSIGAAIASAPLLLVFPLWVWLAVSYAPAWPLVMTEDLSPLRALSRSRWLVRGHFWHAFIVLALGLLMAYLVAQVGLFALVTAAGLLPLKGAALEAVVTLTTMAAVVVAPFPLFPITLTVLYRDLRVRREGLDLDQLAEDAAASA